MDCCTGDIINLGCYQSCDLVQIGINAPATGTYTIELMPDGRRIFSTDNILNNPLIFSNGFGEDGISVFKIIKPDGTYLSIDGDNCFQIENSIALNPALANVEIDPVDCPTLCELIEASSAAEIVECFTPEIEAAVAELICTPGGTCEYDVYFNGNLKGSITVSNCENINIILAE